MNAFDTPRTKTLRDLIEREGPNGTGRIVGLSIEGDGVFIYTNSAQWCDDSGAGTFRGDSETAAVRRFRSQVQKAETFDEAPAAAVALQFARTKDANRLLADEGFEGLEVSKAEGVYYIVGEVANFEEDRCLHVVRITDLRPDWLLAKARALTAEPAAAEPAAAEPAPVDPVAFFLACCRDGTPHPDMDRRGVYVPNLAAVFVSFSVDKEAGVPWAVASWRELAQNSAWRGTETRPGGPVRFPDGSMVTFMAPDGLPVEYVGGVDPEPVTLGERLFPGCECGAAASGNFDRCRCD